MTQQLFIPGWLPTPLNRLMRKHWSKANAAKKADAYTVWAWARKHELQPATGSRRVAVVLRLGKQHRTRDEDSSWKTLLDGLVFAKLLLDDSPFRCRLAGVTQEKAAEGQEWGTLITLEDCCDGPA